MKVKLHGVCLVYILLMFTGASHAQPASSLSPVSADLPPLLIRGQNFVDPQGQNVRFWGVNLIALYPDHPAADALADNLAALQVNLVRLHHLLRPSYDWNPGMTSGSLALYQGNSRDLDPAALDRFDYLNAALRRNGIYLALPLNASREFRPGDVDILQTDDADRTAWKAAMESLNARPWRESIDVYKMLPTIDERAAKLSEEFARTLLGHTNPYTSLAYGTDSQVLTLEVMNEASTEYAVICGNRLPDYWQKKLKEKWDAFATAAGIAPGDLYQPHDAEAVAVRARFLRKLDGDYFDRIKAVVRAAGCQTPLEYSNLWRGENALEMNAEQSDFIETHMYMNPNIVDTAMDGFHGIAQSQVSGKPFIVGELNQEEGEENVSRQAATRTMLPLAASAYGCLQGWNGIVWFAWLHGSEALGPDGWSTHEGRSPEIGRMMNDGMMIDHLRTTGLIFRKGLLKESQSPITLWISSHFSRGDYPALMRGELSSLPGWQNIRGLRKSFGPAPVEQDSAFWIRETPPARLASDTGEIVKDTERKQLTITAPKAEGFSGFSSDIPLSELKHLRLEKLKGFTTIVLVSADDQPLEKSTHLILSRTALDEKLAETAEPAIALVKLMVPEPGQHWYFKQTRPRGSSQEMPLFQTAGEGTMHLPKTAWNEGELDLH